MHSIKEPQVFHFEGADGRLYGADQAWYGTDWQQRAGCGPTVCSHLMWYLARTRPACATLFSDSQDDQAAILLLMEQVWLYVRPGMQGVDTAEKFISGAVRYGQTKGVALEAKCLEIPKRVAGRPSLSTVNTFLTQAFARDLPVAFLNLSNGNLDNLESWHWVTLVDMEGDCARMYDQGKNVQINMAQWLRSTMLGGALVVLEPQAAVRDMASGMG